jgi:hypothetical protein
MQLTLQDISTTVSNKKKTPKNISYEFDRLSPLHYQVKCGPFLSSPVGSISNMLNFQLVEGRGEGVDEVLYIYIYICI